MDANGNPSNNKTIIRQVKATAESRRVSCNRTYTDYLKPDSCTLVNNDDILWSKRVWRVIDSREKINQPFFYSSAYNKSLWEIIQLNLLKSPDTLLAYRALDKKKPFASPMAAPFSIVDSVDAAHVVGLELMEDWYFDRVRSVMDVKIVGISPLVKNTSGDSLNKFTNLLWIYYPQLEPLLKPYYFSFKCDVQRYSFDDFFWKRRFASYIIAESRVMEHPASNVPDRHKK